MTEEVKKTTTWLPITDEVAVLLGRVAFYASWLDDVLGDAVVLGHPGATDHPSSTPGWADSGKRLVAAVRSIEPHHSFIDLLADQLAELSLVRNQLVHGVWLPQDGHVTVMKRSLDKNQRLHEIATYSYADIVAIVEKFQFLGTLADRLVKLLMDGNAAHEAREEAHTPRCPNDNSQMNVEIQGADIYWQCAECGSTKPLE